MNFAPVLIPTLNRFAHFKKCIDSLLLCYGSKSTDLFISLDYPLKDSHWDGYNKILKLIDEIEGFNSVNVIKREVNFGAYKNGSDSLNYIFKKYETLIFTEDDNYFSRDFLIFTNKYLEAYKDDSSVFSVSAYNYPIKLSEFKKNDIYVWQGYSAWGVGFWRDKYMKIDWNKEVIEKTIRDFFMDLKKVKEFNQIANIYVPTLMDMVEKKLIHGDAYICLYQFLNNMVSVFPTVSRVRNLGHDGSGINCATIEDDIYAKQEIYNGRSNYKISNEVTINPEISNLLKKHFSYTFKVKLKLFLKLMLMNIKYLLKNNQI